MKQYRKGLTAVADKCVYISYNRYHSVPESFICCCSGQDSCVLTSRCMLSWLRSAPYPALCPCKPCLMALFPDSTVHCSRPPARNLDISWCDHAEGPWVGFIYTRYSSCRYNERQMIDVTVVRRVRPRAERWCDCEGHRRWKRACRTLFSN